MATTKTVTVSARDLVLSLRDHIIHQLQVSNNWQQHPVMMNLCSSVKCSPEMLWKHPGRTLQIGSVRVGVPDIHKIWLAAFQLLNERNQVVEQIHKRLGGVDESAPMQISQFLIYFDNQPKVEQEHLIRLMRIALSTDALLAYLSLEAKKRLLKQYGSAESMPAEQQQDLKQCDMLIGSFNFILPLFKQVFDYYYWDRTTPPSEAIQQFLPPGSWPRLEPSAPPDEPETLELTNTEVTREDDRIDPTRFDFYKAQLHCRQVVEPKGWWHDRKYVAFMILTTCGQRVAILDCATKGNAAYLFVIGQEATATPEGTTAGGSTQQSSWIEDAVKTKHQLVKEGLGKTFLRRFVHSPGWEQRVKEFLSKLLPPPSAPQQNS